MEMREVVVVTQSPSAGQPVPLHRSAPPSGRRALCELIKSKCDNERTSNTARGGRLVFMLAAWTHEPSMFRVALCTCARIHTI